MAKFEIYEIHRDNGFEELVETVENDDAKKAEDEAIESCKEMYDELSTYEKRKKTYQVSSPSTDPKKPDLIIFTAGEDKD